MTGGSSRLILKSLFGVEEYLFKAGKTRGRQYPDVRNKQVQKCQRLTESEREKDGP